MAGATRIWRNPMMWFDSHQSLICCFYIRSLKNPVKLAMSFCCPWQRSCTLDVCHSGLCCLYTLSPCAKRQGQASWRENKGRPVASPDGPQPCPCFWALPLHGKNSRGLLIYPGILIAAKHSQIPWHWQTRPKFDSGFYFSSTLAALFSLKGKSVSVFEE